ncbi:cytochrome P450 [Aquimarina algicola]|uniref:Cytochrome P450 n=1 Tax=Aquimarina algicola TaxID=2589995 RepID=A0A504IWG0_9FLAO|nr:cytochrome P450 [Aquimarina algicola]TPN82827.1 cytochrome P450 [Aquimarina algicola]
MEKSKLPDPFEKAREKKGYGEMNDQNDPVKILLRLKDVRKTAKNWKTFQSGGEEVGRIVVPSEANIRTTRQIPFEVDPPEHTNYRAIIEPWFKRPNQPEYQDKLLDIVQVVIDDVLSKEKVEVIKEFSLIIQSRALTVLLNTPFEESKTWIEWGTHVFRSEDTHLDIDKANILYDYIDQEIDRAIENSTSDLYSILIDSEINGKKLTKEEVKGVMILTFAGGRDTIINTITNSIAYFAEHPESLDRIKNEPEIMNTAIEELIRYFAPLTHMGRVATEDTQVCEHAIRAQSRISLCWASANRDTKTFENPNEVVLDRKINPHVSFGFGTHNCLGATHARVLLRIIITELVQKVKTIDILNYEDNIEDLDEFKRKVGFNSLTVKFNAR